MSGQNADKAPTPPAQETPRRRYYGIVLALLGVGLLTFMVLMAIDSGNSGTTRTSDQSGPVAAIGTFVMMLVYIGAIAVEPKRFLNHMKINRWLKREKLPQNMLITGFIYLMVFEFAFVIYPFIAVYHYGTGYWEQRRRLPLERRQHVAELEAELGIEPGTDGECPTCHERLQVGAEFCAFCGARAKPVVRVCPVCATTTLPGARWCPKCGTALDAGIAKG